MSRGHADDDGGDVGVSRDCGIYDDHAASVHSRDGSQLVDDVIGTYRGYGMSCPCE